MHADVARNVSTNALSTHLLLAPICNRCQHQSKRTNPKSPSQSCVSSTRLRLSKTAVRHRTEIRAAIPTLSERVENIIIALFSDASLVGIATYLCTMKLFYYSGDSFSSLFGVSKRESPAGLRRKKKEDSELV